MSTTAQKPLRHLLRHLPALLGSVLLGALIPLACILHCHLTPPSQAEGGDSHAHHADAQHRHAAQTEAAGGYTPDSHDHRLCGMHAEGRAALAYPYWLYEITPQSAQGLALVIALLGVMVARVLPRAGDTASAPPTPPPQIAA